MLFQKVTTNTIIFYIFHHKTNTKIDNNKKNYKNTIKKTKTTVQNNQRQKNEV